MTGSREAAWTLLKETLFAEGDPAGQIARRLAAQSEEVWADIVVLSGVHFVTPALWAAIRRCDLSDAVPQFAREYFAQVHEMNTRRNMAILVQSNEVIGSLRASGVHASPLKGAHYLQEGIYEDHGARIVADLDFLVSPTSIETARECLHGMGYQPIGRDIPSHHHLAPMMRSDRPATIELHHQLVPGSLADILPTSMMRGNQSDDGQRRASAATVHLLHRFCHDLITDRHLERLVVPLRSIQDLLALTRFYGDAIDWDWLAMHVTNHGYYARYNFWLYAAIRTSSESMLPVVPSTLARRALYALCDVAAMSPTFGGLAQTFDDCSAIRVGEYYGDPPSWKVPGLRLRRLMGIACRSLSDSARGRAGN